MRVARELREGKESRDERRTNNSLVSNKQITEGRPGSGRLDTRELNFVIRKIDLFNFIFCQLAPQANTPYINKQDCCSNILYGGELRVSVEIKRKSGHNGGVSDKIW